MKIKIKDSKTLKDSIATTKKKIMDAEVDLTKPGIASIANALIKEKEAINNTTSFEDLRDLMKEVVKEFDTTKSREILAKIDELDRLYKRDPRRGSRNDYWLWDKLLKYCYNILLKASGNPSPDVKEETKMKDEDNPVLRICKLLGEAHDKIMEALDVVEDLENSGAVMNSQLRYDLEDLEADLSELDFMGEAHPESALATKYAEDDEDWDWDGLD